MPSFTINVYYTFVLFHILMFNCVFCNICNGNGQLWSWAYGSWIYNYLCKQWLSPLTLWVWMSLNRVYSIQHYVNKFTSDLRQVGIFLHQYNWTPRYSWNIVGIKPHNPHPFMEWEKTVYVVELFSILLSLWTITYV